MVEASATRIAGKNTNTRRNEVLAVRYLVRVLAISHCGERVQLGVKQRLPVASFGFGGELVRMCQAKRIALSIGLF